MPELPEVEVTRQFINESLSKGDKITKVELRRKDLRYEIPTELKPLIKKSKFITVERRAKYLLWVFDNFQIINHLGMTGSWKALGKNNTLKKHDHVIFTLKNGDKLVYSDPRRFGYIDISKAPYNETLKEHRFLKHLGLEPFDKKFTGQYLKDLSKKTNTPVKTFIMDQKIVVGVGNIYACESLFTAGISPSKKASRVTLEKYNVLVKEIKKTLKKAIKTGGSTISDFKTGDNQSGYFQMHFKVYQKTGKPCEKCGSLIKKIVLGGRGTFYCSKCQR
ncbi:MAG: bifunctional DNA-formamidopyrimidine glycosylase/DNA-(apurinic or apyrimidinic site) lyase [Bdellovibrionaceae bacterium]|jgi:formamidopyrimidine-DNA glycosylase|nr:bifunctional DNA-formamidopyrimidine glycosylase/DNA-(apurinic or apyrimidinic site) lyase [Pseudobdellovibrionaceae bacterium]